MQLTPQVRCQSIVSGCRHVIAILMQRCGNRIGRVDGASCCVQARARSADTINTPSTGTMTATTSTHTVSCLLLQLLRQRSTPLLQLLATLNPDVNVKVLCLHPTAPLQLQSIPRQTVQEIEAVGGCAALHLCAQASFPAGIAFLLANGAR